MHVITQRRIWEAKEKYPQSVNALDGWYRVIKRNKFNSFVDLKSTFNSVDIVGDYYVFDIGGNKLRLIASVFFKSQKIFIQEILTHAEYDKRTFKKRDEFINQQLAEAIKHWEYISPVVGYPQNENAYYNLVSYLDKLLALVKDKENHRLAGLVETISNLILAYEEEHFPAPKIKGVEALKYLIQANNLRQIDLREIGSQGVISEILNGKRSLNTRQIKLLAKRFHVAPSTFIDSDN